MRRSRSGERARCRCAARSGRTRPASARSIPQRLPRSRPSRGRSRATPKSCTMRCSRSWSCRRSASGRSSSGRCANRAARPCSARAARTSGLPPSGSSRRACCIPTPRSLRKSTTTIARRHPIRRRRRPRPCAAGWNRADRRHRAASSQRFALPAEVMEAALLRLEAEGQILRGRFTGSGRAAMRARSNGATGGSSHAFTG